MFCLDILYTRSLLLRKEGLKGTIDDLGDGQVIEICLASDRLNPASFDMEGGALGLAAGIARLVQSGFALLPPGHEFCEVAYHADKLLTVHLVSTLGGHVWRRGSRAMFQQFPPMAPISYVTMMSEQSAGDLTSIWL